MNLTAILGRQRLGQIQMDVEQQRQKSMPRRYLQGRCAVGFDLRKKLVGCADIRRHDDRTAFKMG